MKKLFALFFTAGVVISAATAAHSQTLKVNVPFDFVVNGNKLSADAYIIRDVIPTDNTGVLFLGSRHGTQARATAFDYRVTGSKLVFRKLGDEYFLSDVVTLHGALHFAPSRDETKRAGTVAQSLMTVSADN